MAQDNKDKGFDIPSFVSQGEDERNYSQKDENIDMSVFRLDDEESEMEAPRKKPPYRKDRIVVVVIVAVLAVALAIGCIYFTYTKFQEQRQAEEAERLAEEKRKEEEAAAAAEAERQKAEAERLEAERQANLGTYTVEVTVRLRQGPSTDNETVVYDELSDELKALLDDVYLYEGMEVEVLEFTNDSANNMDWGRIGDNVWFCIRNGDDVYAHKNTDTPETTESSE